MRVYRLGLKALSLRFRICGSFLGLGQIARCRARVKGLKDFERVRIGLEKA